jgi:hypothetical protein
MTTTMQPGNATLMPHDPGFSDRLRAVLPGWPQRPSRKLSFAGDEGLRIGRAWPVGLLRLIEKFRSKHSCGILSERKALSVRMMNVEAPSTEQVRDRLNEFQQFVVRTVVEQIRRKITK